MRALLSIAPGGPETLKLDDLPDPQPAKGELLVRVRAAGVNAADLLQRAGRFTQAKEWFEAVHSADPELTDADERLARMQRRSG